MAQGPDHEISESQAPDASRKFSHDGEKIICGVCRNDTFGIRLLDYDVRLTCDECGHRIYRQP